MERYFKFVQYVLLAVVGGTGAALFDGHGLSGSELANVAVVAVTAASVYLTANTPTQPWAKTGVAVLGAGVAVLTSAWSDARISPVEIQQIVLAVLGAVGVASVANVPPGPQPEAPVADAPSAAVPTVPAGPDYRFGDGSGEGL